MSHTSDTDTERLRILTDRLLARDPDAHTEAIETLAEVGDVAIFEAPPAPVERVADDDGIALVDTDGTRWRFARNELRSGGGQPRDRIPGRHGLWFAFRTHYDTAHAFP